MEKYHSDISAQKDSSRKLLAGLNKALMSLMDAQYNEESFRDAFIHIAESTNSEGVFLLEEVSPDKENFKAVHIFGLRQISENWETIAEGTLHIQVANSEGSSSDGLAIGYLNMGDFAESLSIPIHLDQKEWGYFVVASDNKMHQWTDGEKEVLRSFSLSLTNYLSRKRTENALKDQRDYLQNILDQVPSLVYIKDREYKFTMVNKAVSEAYQMSLEEIIGKSNKVFVSDKEQLTQFRKWEEEVLQTGASKTNYINLEVAPGYSIYVQSMKRPIYGPNNEIEGILGVITDLSYQKEIEQGILDQKHFSETITNTIPDTILIVDIEEQEITYSNLQDQFLDYDIKEIADSYEFFKRKIHPDDFRSAVKNIFKTSAETSGTKTFESELRVKDSKDDWFWFRMRLKVLNRDENDQGINFLVVLQDITQEKLRIEELAKSEQRYRNFVEYSSDGIYFINCGQDISIHEEIDQQAQKFYETAFVEECNLALAKMYGEEDIANLQGKKIAEVYRGEFFEKNFKAIKVLIENGYRANNIETIGKDKDGNWKYFLNHAVAIIENDQLIGVWGTQQDITEQKKTELALRESQERFDMVVDSVNLGTWDWNLRNNQILYNKYWGEMLGYQLEELSPDLTTFLNAIHEEDADGVLQIVQHHLQNGTPYFEGEFRMKTKDGNWKWILDRGKVMDWDENGIPIRALGTHMDITQRKESEILLKESEEFFRNLFEESPFAIAFVDMDGAVFRVNPQFCQMLEFEEGEIIGKELTTFYHEEEDLFQVLAEESDMDDDNKFRFEKCFISKNGKQIWARIAMGFVQDEEGSFKHIICMVEDVTDRVEAQMHLSERDNLNHAILNALPDVKFRMDKNGVLLNYFITEDVVSDLFSKPKELLGKNIKDVLPAAISFGIVHNANAAIKEKKVKSFEYILPIEDEINYFEARISQINEEEVIIVVRNITALKKARLSLQEKLKELDEKNKQLKEYIDSNMQLENFAYIASHDLREPVRTMGSFAQLLQKKYADQLDESANTYIKFIVDSSNHMNNLIQDLLTYSRIDTQEHEMESLDINVILERTITGLKELIEEKNAEIYIEGKMPTIKANETKMKQLFQNLINNAIKFHKPDASPKIRIECKELEFSWKFKIKDNGIGILPEFKDKIFVLFKKLHRRGEYEGTGLGLAICKKIVEQHGGDIYVDSMLDSGATFTFSISKDL